MVLGHLCLGLYPAGKGPFQPPHPVLLYEVLVCAGVAQEQGQGPRVAQPAMQ